jgi:hypothetical protein
LIAGFIITGAIIPKNETVRGHSIAWILFFVFLMVTPNFRCPSHKYSPLALSRQPRAREDPRISIRDICDLNGASGYPVDLVNGSRIAAVAVLRGERPMTRLNAVLKALSDSTTSARRFPSRGRCTGFTPKGLPDSHRRQRW